MREIKFRVWHKEKCKHIPLTGLCFWEGQGELTGVSVDTTEYGEIYDLPISEFVIEQYTGLKDKNGAEIYEGDVVEISRGVGYESKQHPSFASGTQIKKIRVVEWSEEWAGYAVLHLPFDSNFCHEIKVIGNIHENPELLKEGNK